MLAWFPSIEGAPRRWSSDEREDKEEVVLESLLDRVIEKPAASPVTTFWVAPLFPFVSTEFSLDFATP